MQNFSAKFMSATDTDIVILSEHIVQPFSKFLLSKFPENFDFKEA